MPKKKSIVVYITGSFLFLMLTGCHAQRSKKNNQPKESVEITTVANLPSWAVKQPIDPDYYIGIAGVEKKPGDREYKNQARKQALYMLGSQIEVKINSNSYLITINRDYKFQQDYLTASKASVNTNIEGYTIVDEYDGEKEYWVFLRLSKYEYKKRQQEKLLRASSTSLNFFEQADKFKAGNQYASAILFYCKALASMKNYLNEAVEADYKGKQIFLVNESFNNLQSLINSIRINFAESAATVKFGMPLNKVLIVNTTLSGQKAANFPVVFKFSSGKGELLEKASSNEQGKINFILKKLSSNQAYQQIDATPDIDAICATDTNWTDIKPFIDRIVKPTGSILLTVIPPKFYSRSIEKNINTDLEEPILMKLIDKKLFDAGLQLTLDKKEADYIIELDANTTKGSVAYEMVNAQLKLNLTVKRRNEVIYTQSKTDIKGIKLTAEEAGMNAYKNATEYISNIIIPDLYKLIFN
jgi:hypothetical protein